MKNVYLEEAKHIAGHVVFLRFNDGLCGEVDLRETIEKYDIATSLRDPEKFSEFYLDSWPTLAWKCGFDIAPESLHHQCEEGKRIEATG